jgi:O-succinylbenzoate synthase
MLFILVVFSFLCVSNCIEIPGCPDIAQLSATANELEGEKLAHIKCVCAEESRAGIEVNCVFGASLDDLATVLDTIGKLNKTVQQVSQQTSYVMIHL